MQLNKRGKFMQSVILYPERQLKLGMVYSNHETILLSGYKTRNLDPVNATPRR
jgi:hypothetical protein